MHSTVHGLRDSFYCDTADGQIPVESVIIQDWIPHLDRYYRTLEHRNQRILEGFSMGGFGAAHLGFKYPEIFGAVSILDRALLDADQMKARHRVLWERHGDNGENTSAMAKDAAAGLVLQTPFRRRRASVPLLLFRLIGKRGGSDRGLRYAARAQRVVAAWVLWVRWV